MQKLVFVGLLLISIHSAAEEPAQPAATEHQRNIASAIDLENEISRLKTDVDTQNFDAAGCTKFFSESYFRFWNAAPTDFAPTRAARDVLKSKAPQLIQKMFEARLSIRKKIAELVEKGQASRSCTNAARATLRAARFVEDVLGQLQLGFPANDPKKMPPVLKGGLPWVVKNPQFANTDLKSGDLLLSRGNAFTSAAIARISESDHQFSHIAVIYIDPTTKKIETIESHIEIGSVVAPIEKYLADGKTRSVIYRYRDPVMAHRAAAMIRDEINNYKKTHGTNYPYDFKMEETKANEIFCSELVRRAFELASGGKVILPTVPSLVNPKNPIFMQRLGIQPGETILPGDIDLDSRFDLVGEWRDYTRMTGSHIHDSILTTMFDWMDRYDYRLFDDGWTKIKTRVVWNLRRWPLFSDWIEEKLPLNMSQGVIGTVTTLNRVSAILQTYLENENAKQLAAAGLPLSAKQMYEKLDELRKADLQKWNTNRSQAVLHHILRAP